MLNTNKTIKHLSFIIFLFIFSGIHIENSFSQTNGLNTFETAKNYFTKGFIFFNRMQYLSAVEYFRKAVSVYPEYYTAREYLARSYKLAGFIDEAIKEWEIIANMSSNNVAVLNKLDALRYRMSAEVQGKLSIGSRDFVFSDAYNAANMGRYRLSKPIDLSVDSEKNLYITSFYSGKLVKINPNGDGLSIFDRGTATRFYGVDCEKNRVCVSDFKSDSVHILDKDLNLLKTFGSTGSALGQFHGPKGIKFDKDSNIYIVDSGNSRIQKFDKDGNFILKFGEPGEYEGQMDNPSGICIDNNAVYVSDTGNKRIACFDDSGNFIKNLLIKEINTPRGISLNNKNLIISDEKNGLVFYSLENGASFRFNSWDNGKKNFSRLVSAQADRDGILYCLDHNYENVFVFSPLQAVYSNLDIEITSVDVNKYPVVAYYLNVRTRKGNPVYNLEGKNFKIIEDNATAANLYADYLKNQNPSTSIVLCVDRSKSNMGYHNDIPWISDFILTKMKKNDSLQLLNFNKDAWVGNEFEWSRLKTIKALRKRNYSDGKAVDKALYNAISNLLPKINRRGVVFISDGTVGSDSFTRYTPENIIEYAKSHFIPIYIIVFKDKDPILKRIAEETGGSIFKANELDGLRSIYNKIKEAEEFRYVVIYTTYKTPSIKGWWSDIKIEVNYKGNRGVEWGGYFVP
jgi:DNA-binding beta-propeller fold protein YncE